MVKNQGWKFIIQSASSNIDLTTSILEAANGGYFDTHTIREVLSNHQVPKNYDEQFLVVSNKERPYWRTVSLRLSWFFSFNTHTKEVKNNTNNIVYYVNSYVNPNYWILCFFQLSSLKRSGLLSDSNTILNIVFAGNEKSQSIFSQKIKKALSAYENFVISYTTDNSYEYPGIHKVKMLAKENPDGNILYFHPKGLSHINLNWLRAHRIRIEKRLFRYVIEEWRENLAWLNHIPSINKLGLQAGGEGWIWYNFWWARCSYINTLEEPVKTEWRYYYEHWLSKKSNGESDIGDCISAFSIIELGVPNLGYLYTPNSYENRLAFYSILNYRLERIKINLRRIINNKIKFIKFK